MSLKTHSTEDRLADVGAAPVKRFCDRHGLRIGDVAHRSGRSWVTAQKWHKGVTSPQLSDAQRLVDSLREDGRKASLNDFDPGVAA